MGQDQITPEFFSSFDPAIFLHSEIDRAPAASFSDDLTAIQLQIQETTTEKNRKGIVIQHRAWKTNEVFRSEEDHPIYTPSKNQFSRFYYGASQEEPVDPRVLRSSPPLIDTPKHSMSSPVVFPLSLAGPDSLKKRRKLDERAPLKAVNGNARMIGGFIEVDTDDEDDVIDYVHKTPKAAQELSREPEAEKDTDLEPVNGNLNERPEQHGQADFPLRAGSEHQVVDAASSFSQFTPALSLLTVNTFGGRCILIGERRRTARVSLEQMVASRSTTEPGRANKSHYGIDIHDLLEDLSQQSSESDALKRVQEATTSVPTVEKVSNAPTGRKKPNSMWTEKYRAKKFTDLVGDERTHRQVLRWLKGWDPIVFPGSVKPKSKTPYPNAIEEKQHRKILLLTGPPGLGKTTLAHVCARQAGYEVQEINASDERSRDVVKGRIRDMVATENVRGIATGNGKSRKAGKPVCVVVDEVDGVVTGSGGGEGGFIKALMDLVLLDQRNAIAQLTHPNTGLKTKQKKGDRFRMLRPLILICNDVYHPSLRPLRQSSLAEIVHIRKPALNMVVSRVHSIFEKEGLSCDSDGVRRLCEATWGVSGRGSGQGGVEGDIRSIMVVGEWIAARFRSSSFLDSRLTKRWVEDNVLTGLSYGGGAARGLGRGGTREVVERIFQHGAGFPMSSVQNTKDAETVGVIGVAEATKRWAMSRLRDMIDTSGDVDRILTDCFTSYPMQPIQDDNFLTKPNVAYDWLNFHDKLSSQVTKAQDWELAPYLSSTVLAFHHLFAASATARHTNGSDQKYGKDDEAALAPAPFFGPSAPYTASETTKTNNAAIVTLQSSLSLPLARLYRSHSSIASELLPYILRILAPDVKPVVINISTGNKDGRSAPTASVRKADEKERVSRAVECMAATGVRFERSKVEDVAGRSGGWVYRMEPGLDSLGAFETLKGGVDAVVRFAVRQVLEGEWRRRSGAARKTAAAVVDAEEVHLDGEKSLVDKIRDIEKSKERATKRDFFGRKVIVPTKTDKETGEVVKEGATRGRVWVSFHEGFSNAVRKPITLQEFLGAL